MSSQVRIIASGQPDSRIKPSQTCAFAQSRAGKACKLTNRFSCASSSAANSVAGKDLATRGVICLKQQIEGIEREVGNPSEK